MPYQFKCSFHCPQPDKITKIIFSIICKQYFVVYLNGKEVARNKAPTTTCEHIDLTAYKSNLQAGNNKILIELQQMELEIPTAHDEHMLFMVELNLE